MTKAGSTYTRILHGTEPGMRMAKGLLLLSLGLLAFATIRTIVVSAVPPLQYRHDLLQEYLLGKAVWAGVDPYMPLPALMTLFFPEINVTVLPHSTPHPPPVILLGLPLALLPYSVASAVWTAVELLMIVVMWWILSSWLDLRFRAEHILLAAFLTLGWNPYHEELAYRQLMILLLALLLGAGLLEHRDRSTGAGVLLGFALSLKLLGWPILMFWAVRRKWSATIVACLTIGALNALAVLILDPRVVFHYYAVTAKNVTPYYQAFAFNLSPWTVGWRLFSGTGSPVLMSITAPPLIQLAGMAPIISLSVIIILFVSGMALAKRTTDSATGFTMLLCLSVLMSPVTWVHYFTWILPPLVVLGKLLHDRALPPLSTSIGLGILLTLAIPGALLTRVVCLLSSDPLCPAVQVSFLAGALTYVQPLAVISLIALMYRASRTEIAQL